MYLRERVVETLDTQWKDVPGFEGVYRVSTAGEVWSSHKRGPLTPMRTGGKRKQYSTVMLCAGAHSRTVKVHRLVLEVFVGPAEPGQVACHRDDNTFNNSLGNLYWGTLSDNARDRVRLGNHSGQRLSVEQVLAIRTRRNAGERGMDLAKEFGVTQQVIWNVYSGRTGGYITE